MDAIAVLAAAAVITAVVAFRRKLALIPRAITSYGPLQEKVSALEAELAELREERSLSTARAEVAFEEGAKHGRLEIRGSVLGGLISKMPTVHAVQVFQGDLVLVAKGNAPRGTWLSVVDAGTDEVKGFAEVVLVDGETNSLHLSCVRDVAPEFWQALKDRAAVDSTPPPRLELRRPPPAFPSKKDDTRKELPNGG